MSLWVVTWQVGSTDVQIHVSRSQLLKMMEHNSRKVRDTPLRNSAEESLTGRP